MNWLLYSLGRSVFSLYLRVFHRLKIHGADNIPKRKPFIICSNHINWKDPTTVGVAFPRSIDIKFMAKKELFKNPFISYALRQAGAFPVDRENADYGAIKKAYQLLNNKQVLGLFPEGSRSKTGELQKAYNGAALIAVRSGVPIVPVAISGTYKICKPLNIYIGRPFVLPPLIYDSKEEKKLQLEEMSYMIMENIGRLITEKVS